MRSPIIRSTTLESDVSQNPTAVLCDNVYDVEMFSDSHGKLHSLMWDLDNDKFFIEVNRERDYRMLDAEGCADINLPGWHCAEVTVCMAVVEFPTKVEAMRKWLEVQGY